ncbi:hypothetical protein ABZP36_027633 [Zizania latifolia]
MNILPSHSFVLDLFPIREYSLTETSAIDGGDFFSIIFSSYTINQSINQSEKKRKIYSVKLRCDFVMLMPSGVNNKQQINLLQLQMLRVCLLHAAWLYARLVEY